MIFAVFLKKKQFHPFLLKRIEIDEFSLYRYDSPIKNPVCIRKISDFRSILQKKNCAEDKKRGVDRFFSLLFSYVLICKSSP